MRDLVISYFPMLGFCFIPPICNDSPQLGQEAHPLFGGLVLSLTKRKGTQVGTLQRVPGCPVAA